MNRKRFLELCLRNAHGCEESLVDGWYQQLRHRYEEAHRRYHTPDHVQHCLLQMDSIPGLLESPDALEFAIWYHDVIYDIARSDNEQRSAELFRAHAAARMPAALVAEVCDLIMVTAHLDERPQTGDQMFMVDIDLSSFGMPWPKFLEDSIAVREESFHLTDAEFYPRQAQFLRQLLERTNFYFTPLFRDRHEKQARANVARYLDQLEGGGLLGA